MSGKIAGKNPTRRPATMTKKQRALVKAKIANPDATLVEAGRKAGYEGDDASVAVSASRALKSANVQERFREAMERRKKLSDEALLVKLEEGLGATTTKFFAHEGHVVDQEDCIDYSTRGTYLALATKLKGVAADKVELTGAGGKDLVPAQVVLPPLSKEALLALINMRDEAVGGTKAEGEAGKPA